MSNTIRFRGNQLKSASELKKLKDLPQLRALSLAGKFWREEAEICYHELGRVGILISLFLKTCLILVSLRVTTGLTSSLTREDLSPYFAYVYSSIIFSQCSNLSLSLK